MSHRAGDAGTPGPRGAQSLRQKKEDGGASEAEKPGLEPPFCLFAGLGWLVLFRALASSLHPHLKEAPSGKNELTRRFLCWQVGTCSESCQPSSNRDKKPWAVGRCTASIPDNSSCQEGLPVDSEQVQAFPTRLSQVQPW